jgi:GntR family transcriptional repressor for pyruvate dehydrogenase complex
VSAMSLRPAQEESAATGVNAPLAETVFQKVLHHIQSNRLQFDDVLPSENELSQQLGISRGIVREAIRGLANLGIITIGNGRKPRVGRLSGDVLALLTDHALRTEQVTVMQTLDVRRVLEVRAAQLAALHRTDAEARLIRAAAKAMRDNLPDYGLVTYHDIEFHICVAGASRNPLLRLQIESFRYVIQRTGPIGWRTRLNQAAIMQQVNVHAEIADAIAASDPHEAAALMSRHFTDSVAVLTQAGFN